MARPARRAAIPPARFPSPLQPIPAAVRRRTSRHRASRHRRSRQMTTRHTRAVRVRQSPCRHRLLHRRRRASPLRERACLRGRRAGAARGRRDVRGCPNGGVHGRSRWKMLHWPEQVMRLHAHQRRDPVGTCLGEQIERRQRAMVYRPTVNRLLVFGQGPTTNDRPTADGMQRLSVLLVAVWRSSRQILTGCWQKARSSARGARSTISKISNVTIPMTGRAVITGLSGV